jgi:putative solute:sodium symporter small subunit|tara:strand:+ start:354 stop:665 length:312 start_codon:yes stop_codon:yes gene_type:complete
LNALNLLITTTNKPFKMIQKTSHKKYWKTNLKYLTILLSVWFLTSYVFGILLVDSLNEIQIWGFPLGFWFAQQGAIYVFVILIFVYVYLMNRLDKAYGFDQES